jgi:hypothetical protein
MAQTLIPTKIYLLKVTKWIILNWENYKEEVVTEDS